jgi:hypothetical protein
MNLVISNKKNRSLISFKLFMDNNFLMWVLFPTRAVLNDFKNFAKQGNINILCQSTANFFKTHRNKDNIFYDEKSLELLTSGGIHVITCKSVTDMNLLLSFFVKEKFLDYKNFSHIKFPERWTDFFSNTNSFVVAFKVHEHIFYFNESFLKFFQRLNYNLYLNKDFYILFFFRIVFAFLHNLLVMLFRITMQI